MKMKVCQIVYELEQIYSCGSCYRLKGITGDDFRYISDFEDVPPLTEAQYEEHLKRQLENFYPPIPLRFWRNTPARQ